MYELFKDVLDAQPQLTLPIATVVSFFGVCLAAFIAREVRKFVTHRADLDAKREMIDRGMSADEIERVFRAGQE